MNRKKRRKL